MMGASFNRANNTIIKAVTDKIEYNYRETNEKKNSYGFSDSVYGIIVHPLEYLYDFPLWHQL
jgi:hypothetical protein